MDKKSAAITLVTLGVVLFLGVTVYGQTVAGDPFEDRRETINRQVEYCENNGGDAWNAQSVSHGGMHCELPDGTILHLWQAKAEGYPDNPHELADVKYGTHGSTPWFGLGRIVPTFLAVFGLAIGIVAIIPYLPGKAGKR